MKSFFRLLLLTAICFLAMTNTMQAQCNPDVTAPVAICDQFVNVSVGLNCSATIAAAVFDDGSYDNCTSNVDFRVEVATAPSATPPTTTTAIYSALGTYNTILWVGDSAGNWNQCMITVMVEDKLDPIAICETQVDMTINGPTSVPASAFDDGSFDNCAGPNLFYEFASTPSATPPSTTSHTIDASYTGSNDVILWAGDNGTPTNWSTCASTLVINGCIPGTPLACNNSTYVSLDQNGMAVINPDMILEGGPYCQNNWTYGLTLGSGLSGNTITLDASHIGTHPITVHSYEGSNTNPTASCWGTIMVTNPLGCQGDTIPPVAICESNIDLTLLSSGLAVLTASEVDDGSYDNCAPNVNLQVRELPNNGTMPPLASSVVFSDTGLYIVELWVTDTEGNVNTCVTQVNVTDCNNPALSCNSFTQVALDFNNSATLYPDVILEGGPYCSNFDYLIEIEPDVNNPMGTPSVTFDSTHANDTLEVAVYSYLNGSLQNSCWGHVYVQASSFACSPDVTAPVAIANVSVNIALSNGSGILTPAQVDDGSYDFCSPVNLLIFQSNTSGAVLSTPSDTIVFTNANTGQNYIGLLVTDASGNTNTAISTILVGTAGCLGDIIAPTVISPADMTVSETVFDAVDLTDQAQIDAAFGAPTATDNCGVYAISNSFTIVDNNCQGRIATRMISVLDTAFNLTEVQQVITVELESLAFHIPANFAPGDTNLDTLSISSGTNIVSYDYRDIVFDYDCDGSPDKILRTWSVFDWCAYTGAPAVEIPQLDWDGDGLFGDAYDIASNGTDLITLQGNPPFSVGQATGLYEYLQKIRYNNLDAVKHKVTGTVFHDANDNCTNDGENGLSNWKVVAIGLPSGEGRSTTTDSLGTYSISVCLADTAVSVSLNVPYNYGGATCPTTYTVNFTADINTDETVQQDIGAQLDNQCPLMVIDMASPKIRPCFAGNYVVSYANISNQTIIAPYVEVDLDAALNFTSSSIPSTLLSTNKYRFDLTDLTAGESGQFNINFFTDCATPPGMTHCSEAHLYPDTLCPQSPLWSGANIEVAGTCVSDSVYFTISNTGLGNSQLLDFVVVEDVIMRESGTFTLSPGGVYNVNPYKANGATFRIQADQEPGHPFGGMPSAAVEGCDGFTPGMVTLFPTGNSNPFITNVCQENVSSFDPNDKQANPVGYGSEHFIEPNTDIEYTIRFQNTGTDTAFNIVIMDTLSQNVDATKVRALAASHPYRFERINGNVLRFSFDNVMLPDSNVNEPLSNGFVKFRIAQLPDLQDYTRIENNAAIYFDFNEPIITNTAFHTVKEDFLTISSVKTHGIAQILDVYPNPATDFIYFDGDVTVNGNQRFVLTDMQGKTVHTATIDAWPYRFERKGLSEGVYFFQIQNETQGMLYTGKVLLK